MGRYLLCVRVRLHVEWHFSVTAHRPQTIARLTNEYLAILRRFLDASEVALPDAIVASDFPLAGLEQSDVEALARLLTEQ